VGPGGFLNPVQKSSVQLFRGVDRVTIAGVGTMLDDDRGQSFDDAAVQQISASVNV
jgi:hypothetical protein